MIRVEKTHLPVAALTHPGMKGKNNEDRFGVSAFRINAQTATPVLLAVLSDGIGGNRAGEVASELAVNLISQYAADSDGRNPPQILDDAIHTASEQIFLQAQENPEQHGMGATCACAWIAGDQLYCATVGDSRIYLMRDETIKQLSTDHTWIQEALERGLIQPDQVNGHPNAHVIRRYLGSPTPPEVDFRIRLNSTDDDTAAQTNQGFRLLPNDRLLLCSDGLTDLVSADEILVEFTRGTLEEAGQRLIDLANQRGGHDNITLITIQIPDISARTIPATVTGGTVATGATVATKAAATIAEPAPPLDGATVKVNTSASPSTAAASTVAATPTAAAKPARSRMRSLLAGCLTVVILAVLVGALAGGYFLYSGRAQGTPTQTATITATVTPTGPTRTSTSTRTPTITPSPFNPATSTATPRPNPALRPSSSTLTPWPTNTPGLPIVTP